MTACPDEATLRRFLHGALDTDAGRAVDAHLACCRECRRRLDEAARLPDGVRALVALAGDQPQGAETPPCASSPTGEHAAAGGPPELPGYEVLGELGRGGMGVVYRARDLSLRREVAVKVLAGRLAGQPQARRRFVEEAHIAAQLQHPGVAAVHELGALADGRPFLAMKLVRGQTLAALLQRRAGPPPDLARLVQVFAQLCQAVAYAHSRGIIHRDLKPGNVMVGSFGEVQVMDWGLAKVLAGRAGTAPAGAEETPGTVIDTPRAGGSAWQTQGALGTYAYMAPEQARGQAARVAARSDVFGLGAILCEVLTGRPPYDGRGEEVRRQAEDGDLGPALARLDGCGADRPLVELARACLAARAERRPPDAGVVAAAVAGHQAGVQERARQAERGRAAALARAEEARATAAAERQARQQAQAKATAERRARRLAVGLAAALLLTALAGGGGWLWLAQDRAARERSASLALGK